MVSSQQHREGKSGGNYDNMRCKGARAPEGERKKGGLVAAIQETMSSGDMCCSERQVKATLGGVDASDGP